MMTFNQKTDSYRPTNRITYIPQVDIVKTLETFTVDDVVEKIQKVCKQKSIRISEFMRDFDKLRSGSISTTQFLRSISSCKIYLSNKESELLVEKYKSIEKCNEILWRNFCDDIDQVFVIKQLEKLDDVADLTKITKSSFKLNELSLPDQAVLQEVLKEMKAFFEVNRIDPKPAFTNYDHLKRGKVLLPQFKKICHSMKLMINDPNLEILMKKYGDPINNEINYVVILNDAKENGQDKRDTTNSIPNNEHLEVKEFVPCLSGANNFYTYQTHFLQLDFNIKDVIDKIKNVVKINRIRLQEFFNDFDTLRKGIVSKAKFRTALDMAHLELRAEEYDVLEKHYELPDDSTRVQYKDLVEKVDTVFTLKGLEKHPLERPEKFKMPNYLDPVKRLNSEEAQFLHQVMFKLACLMKKYRVLTKDYFKDADKAKIGIIPSSKFASIMNFLKLNVEEDEMNILIKRFHIKSNIEIDYFDFDHVLAMYCEELENEE